MSGLNGATSAVLRATVADPSLLRENDLVICADHLSEDDVEHTFSILSHPREEIHKFH
jgi:hypothetical protein